MKHANNIKPQKTNKFLLSALALTLSASLFTTAATHATTNEITITYPYYGFVENPNHPWTSVYDALNETGEINYSDDYFTVPSPGDHPELRALSYALALAGFENQADGYPATTTAPYPKLTNFLDQMGFSDYEHYDMSSERDGHSMGTTIARKTLPDGTDLVVIAPRNYNYMTEWLSNFNVGTSGDHAGFAESANLITSRFHDYINSRNLTGYKLWVVGYSRGGGVVDLFARDVNEYITDYHLSPDDFYVYTFGAPRASIVPTNYSNIHDVKDGNDLILGYLFPEPWGFYNTGVYEEIHPADLTITTSVVNISNLTNSTRALGLLSTNEGLTEPVGEMNGREFMDEWINFVTANGLTREYFNDSVKPPLSAIMQAYQLRTLDKQSEFTDFLKDTDKGLPAMIAGNAFADLLYGPYPGSTIEERLANFPPYQDLVKILEGTASPADMDELITFLTTYMGEYSDYESKMHITPTVTESEYAIIKDNLPVLARALLPVIVADAAYTRATYGDDYSLYYTYTLIANAENLVIGHIPESIMPILKSLIPVSPEPDNPDLPVPDTDAPNTGYFTADTSTAESDYSSSFILIPSASLLLIIIYITKKSRTRK